MNIVCFKFQVGSNLGLNTGGDPEPVKAPAVEIAIIFPVNIWCEIKIFCAHVLFKGKTWPVPWFKIAIYASPVNAVLIGKQNFRMADETSHWLLLQKYFL